MKTTQNTFYVLPEGATQEEQLDWETIEEMCRSGQFSPNTRIFLPDRNTWVPARDTELRSLLADVGPVAESTDGEAANAESSALEGEYQQALRLAGENPKDPDAHVEAGRVAAELGDREAARGHFQRALKLRPFHPRIAQEVQRRFSKSECKGFLYLRRDPAVWDDPSELVAYPFSAGPLYLVAPAAALFVLSLIPLGLAVAAAAVYLWGLQVSRRTAEGADTPPLWHAAVKNPIREIVLPLVAGAAVTAECVLVVYGAGRLALALGGGEGTAFRAVAESPVLSVTLVVIALGYLPAVFVKITHSAGIIVNLLSPWTVLRGVERMGQEYAVTTLIILFLAFLLGGVKFLLGGIPVFGNLILAVNIAVLVPVTGFILGRLAGRVRHVL